MHLVLARYDTFDDPVQLFADRPAAERLAKSLKASVLQGKKDAEGYRPRRPVNVSIVSFRDNGKPESTDVIKWFN